MLKSRLIYAAIIVAAFIFSQALYDSISLFTLICVLLLPVLSFVLLLLCRTTVGIRCRLARGQVYRYSQTNLLVEVKCGAPFLSPLIKIKCILPDLEGKESVIRKLPVAFSPFSKTVIEIPIKYSYRGTYDVGIRSVEVSDFLRLFSLPLKIDEIFKLHVTPRFLPSELRVNQDIYLEDGTSADMLASATYGGELFGVRDFDDNDSLRYVHWNLSAVKDTLMVKTYSVNRQKQIYVLLDMTDKEYQTFSARRMGDVIMEAGLSLCMDLLNRVGAVCLMWESGGLKQCTVDSPQRLSIAYEQSCLCPMQPEKALDTAMAEISNVQALCIVTGRLTEQKLSRVELLQTSLNCPIRLLVFENVCAAQEDVLRSKDISLELLSLEDVEKGKVVS
ncbi:MAG: DUF58 domain-containing protein [Clostridia bacterium]|nr:DUF58 domain-containing protein [Clostridia bacterium]